MSSQPPAALTESQVQFMREQGYLSVPRLIDDSTLHTLRDYYDKILRKEISCGDNDRHLGGVTRQVMYPRNHIPYFQDNPALQLAHAFARQIFNVPDTFLCFDMLIYKPPGHPKSTPWHQDYAYTTQPVHPAGSPLPLTSLQFWIPLDDVDFSNGCMHFVPKSHIGTLEEHYVYAGSEKDEGRLLATRAYGDPDQPNNSVPCPLSAGGCTIHYFGTAHYTPPNITQNRGRRAYIFNLRTKE